MVATSKIGFGKIVHIVTTAGDEQFILIRNHLDGRYTVLSEITAVGEGFIRRTSARTIVHNPKSVREVVLNRYVAEKLFSQYVATHEGVQNGTHYVKETKTLKSVVKDSMFKEHSEHYCEACGAKMNLVVHHKGTGVFFGCSKFRSTGCKGTRDFRDPSRFHI